MESLSSRFLISSTYNKFPATYCMNPVHTKTLRTNFQYFSHITHSKKSSYQDFQEYAKPSRLLPATDLKVCTDASSVESAFASFLSGESELLYKVELRTSKIYGSGLSDVNSGVLLCLIGENGSSILQRLPSTFFETDKWSENKVIDDTLHFQRGSIDEFAFEGPNLGRIIAVWISLESGQWRIGGLNLTVISPCEASSAENKQLNGLQYNFEFDDILLGEKGEASMMEFRPHSVTALSRDEVTLFNQNSLDSSSSLVTYATSNEESMREYAYLKFSLLFYDVVLILAGSLVASIITGENAAYEFLTGGLCGFFYLLLLQRSVDGLSAPELIPIEKKGSFSQMLGRLKGSVSIIALALAFAIIAVKYGSGEDAVKLTPKDLIFGIMGFLMCKVSVVLAAFKPMPLSLRDNKQDS